MCSTSSFSPNPQTPSASGATSTLTVTTTGAAAAMYRPSRIFYLMWLPIVGLSLVGMRWTGTQSRRKKLLGFLLLGLIMATLFFLPACGGSSNNGGGGGGGRMLRMYARRQLHRHHHRVPMPNNLSHSYSGVASIRQLTFTPSCKTYITFLCVDSRHRLSSGRRPEVCIASNSWYPKKSSFARLTALACP